MLIASFSNRVGYGRAQACNCHRHGLKSACGFHNSSFEGATWFFRTRL